MPKLQPGLPEARFGSGTPEKNAKAEPRVDGGCRSRSSSSMPTSPKPLLQSPKPSPSARPSIPQKPRTASRPEDTPDSPSGPSSPKVALLPPILKKVSSDKERDGQNSSQSSPRSFSQEGKNIFFLWIYSPQRMSFQNEILSPRLKRYLGVQVSLPWI